MSGTQKESAYEIEPGLRRNCVRKEEMMDFSALAEGLQHIGIPTGDLGKSIAFYQGIGFRQELLTKHPETGEQVAFLKLGDLVLEVYESKNPAGKDGAINHFAIGVTDIEAAYQLARENGLHILEPVQFLPFWEKGVRFFIVEGPDRERVEFCQVL